MKIEDFWNNAYLACLSRLPPEEAEKQATEATNRCIEFWQANMERRGLQTSAPLWKDQDVTWVPLSGDRYREILKRHSTTEQQDQERHFPSSGI
ncbi:MULTISPECIES: hypothetical protein [Xanthomonas]|uniref:hypothetical protein n=1 Tax=Xanthomonas TaxID=338 RepID=UPI0012D9C7B9|nr:MULTISPECIES: hypothetical protein [Xanthomonas]MDY4284353.1 hypothetical protein [Xanthomonas sp. LF06-19]